MREKLKKLCGVQGVSGRETPAAQVAAEMLREFCEDVSVDVLGSVHGHVGNGEYRILLDAHLDQIGLIVTNVLENGFLRVSACGGMDRRVLIGKPVTVYGKRVVHGIMASVPPHLSGKSDEKLPEITEMLVDTGLSEEECRECVAPGDIILPELPWMELLGDRVASPALDDRCSIAAVLRCLELLKGETLPCTLCVQFAVREEVGGMGAMTGAYQEEADEVIAIDVSFAKQPGTTPEVTAELGKGPIVLYGTPVDYRISRKMTALANENGIPVQVEVCGRSSGTDADEMVTVRGGAAAGVVSVPQKNMHTGVEIIDLQDVENTARLLAEYVRMGGACRG